MLASVPFVSPRDFSRLAPFTTSLQQTHVRSLSTEHRPGTPTSPEGDVRNEREREVQNPNAYLHVSALAELDADEQMLELRKANIRRFGATWIKPPGIPKTLQAMIDEQVEKEEQEAIARREAALHEALRAQEAQLRAQRIAEQPMTHEQIDVEHRDGRTPQQNFPGSRLHFGAGNLEVTDLDAGTDRDLDAEVPNAAEYESDDYDEVEEDEGDEEDESEEIDNVDARDTRLEFRGIERHGQGLAVSHASTHRNSAEYRRHGDINSFATPSNTSTPIGNTDGSLPSHRNSSSLSNFAGGADNRLRNLRGRQE